MVAYQVLKLLIEIIDESWGLDKMVDNFTSLTLLVDALLDYGFPLVTEKSILVNMLEGSGILNKAQDAITGASSSKITQTLSTAIN